MSRPVPSTLNPAESAGIGALSGIIEVSFAQPSVYIKNALQNNTNLTLNPRVLYRGVGVNAGSMAPISAVQFYMYGLIENRFKAEGITITESQRLSAAATAGAASAVVGGPAELVMIQQQHSGNSLLQQVHRLRQQYGFSRFSRGMLVTAGRDGIFSAAYLGATPALQERFSDWYLSAHPTLAAILAATVSGTIAAVISQPLDTVKTRMQSNLDSTLHRSFLSTCKEMYKAAGIRTLYKGAVPRTQRIVCAVFILAEAKERLSSSYAHTLRYPITNTEAN